MSEAPTWTDERVLERNRARSAGQRLARVFELGHLARVCHAAVVRLENPTASLREVHREWMRFCLGDALLNDIIASGHDIYRHLPDDPIIVEVSTPLKQVGSGPAIGLLARARQESAV
jgi:hypothetical protein